MSTVPIINIKFVPAGVELVLQALNKLPREQVDGLWQEVYGQYSQQLAELRVQGPAQQPLPLADNTETKPEDDK